MKITKRMPLTSISVVVLVIFFSLKAFTKEESTKERVLNLSDIPRREEKFNKPIDPVWLKATMDRKFRIAPLEVELCEEPPLLENVVLPKTEQAFRVPIIKLVIVRLEDRHCWGVLLVSTDKMWTKVRFGSYIPMMNVNAKKAGD